MKTNSTHLNAWQWAWRTFGIMLLCLTFTAHAAEVAATILAVSGKVEILHGTEKRVPANHAELFSGDTLVTGDGQVQLRFADGTLLTLYRDTKFAIDDYHYEKGKGDRAQFSLLNGVMHTLTGQIDKRNYLLKTRLANLGVRGTEYSVQLDNILQVSVDQGLVEIANAGGMVEVSAGNSAAVISANAIPKPSVGGRIDLGKHGGGHAGHGAPGGHGGTPGGHGGAPNGMGGMGGGMGGPGMGGAGGGMGGMGGAGAPPPPPPAARKF
ncbi:MAG: FecR family protein [Gallionella sp.]|nr:FecR family protein [Gallionella sp.]MDD4958452.1 FecR family protein [Gallionella sp.]